MTEKPIVIGELIEHENTLSGRKWIEVRQFFTLDERVFERRYAPLNAEPTGHFIARGDEKESEVAVICGKCFGDAFKIGFGSYSVQATCVACGEVDEVYSG